MAPRQKPPGRSSRKRSASVSPSRHAAKSRKKATGTIVLPRPRQGRGDSRKLPSATLILDLPAELTVMIFSQCDFQKRILLSNMCKKLYAIGMEVRFRHVSLSLTHRLPGSPRMGFHRLLDYLRFTRTLRVRVSDVLNGKVNFRQLLNHINSLSLKSLDITGPLEYISYSALQRFLENPDKWKTLRSSLRTINLPMLPPKQTWLLEYISRVIASVGQSDCTAYIRFRSQIRDVESFPRDIGVVARHDPVNNSSYGTPYPMIERCLHAFGVKDLDALQLFGERSNLQSPFHIHDNLQTPLHVYDNPIESYGLHFPDKPVRLTELAVHDMNLRQISPAMFTLFNIASLQSLKLKQCYELPSLFKHLMAKSDQLLLQNLEIWIYSRAEPMHSGNPHNFERFCESFSSLKSLTVGVCNDWKTDFKVESLRFHQDLETCVLSLGSETIDIETIRIMRTQQPNLKVLGHRFREASRGLEKGKVSKDGAARIKELAQELVLFDNLEKWQILCDFSARGMKYAAAKGLAEYMRQCCREAKQGHGACTINTISILHKSSSYLQRRAVYAGMVPEGQELQFSFE